MWQTRMVRTWERLEKEAKRDLRSKQRDSRVHICANLAPALEPAGDYNPSTHVIKAITALTDGSIELQYVSSNIIKALHVCTPEPCIAPSIPCSTDVIPAGFRHMGIYTAPILLRLFQAGA